MCLRVMHRVTLNLLPQAVGSELYVACRDDVHYVIFLRYVVTMFQRHLFGTLLTPFVFCAILPLETLPPGDPSGGVVYLRILLSPDEASCM